MKTLKAFKTKQGNWQVNFSESGKQKALYLGRDFTAVSADRVARIVSDVLSCRKRGDSLPLEIFRRIEALPDRIRRSFQRLGLVGDTPNHSLESLVKVVCQSKSHLTHNTRGSYKRCGELLFEFFGKDKSLDKISKEDCGKFKKFLLGRLSTCSVSHYITRCRTTLRYAVDAEWIQRNPFDKIAAGTTTNHDRQVYVDREVLYKVMAYCRDDYDRLLLALARFGGLRIPSEVRRLRFSDFVANEIRIHPETKTGARAVPLFGEVREIFDRIVVNLGQDYQPSNFVFVKLGNFRQRIVAAICAAGVELWAKLFVNLRSSCITDMVERRYSEKMLDAMFGNSSIVRSRHYIQFRKDKEYAKALEDNARLLKMLREGVVEDVLSPEEMGDLLVFRDLLVKRFGTGRKAS